MASTNTPARFSNTGRSSQRDGRDAHSARSVSRTPRFIFGSSAPSSTPQFNATPRFLVAKKHDYGIEDDGVDMGDDGSFSSPSHVLPTRAQRGQSSTQKLDGVVHCSEDEIDRSSVDLAEQASPETHNETGYQLGGLDIDEEFESIFPPSPTARKTKKRRLSSFASEGTQVHHARNDTNIISSSPEPSPPLSPNPPTSPEIRTPSRRQLPSTPLPASRGGPSTQQPASSSLKHPRFMFQPPLPPQSSSSSKFKSPGFQFGASQQLQSQTQATPARKPHFILPSSPVPDRQVTNEEPLNPTSLSPILPRRGRPSRSQTSIPNCVPGGAAATVRNWLFDLGARKQASQYAQHASPIPPPSVSTTPTQTSKTDSTQRYYLTGDIVDVKHLSDTDSSVSTAVTALHVSGTLKAGHPAPMTLALITPDSAPTNANSRLRGDTHAPSKILLFGEPVHTQTRRVLDPKSLKLGDKIGVSKATVWEIELDLGVPAASGLNAFGQEEGAEKWLVAADWEVSEIKDG